MSDLRIQYNEEMVGANHPTKADTLNRLFLGGVTPTYRDSDGKVLGNVFKLQTTPPETGEGEVAVFCQNDADGEPGLFLRRESNGEVTELSGGLDIEKVQPIEASFDYSVTSGSAVNQYVTIEEADPERSFIITDSDYIYSATNQQVRFRWKLDDALTAHFDGWFAWDCNSCGTFTARASVYTLKNKPKKLQYVEPAAVWPLTVEETDPDSTLILRACGHHPLNLELTDSMTLDTGDTYPSGYSSYRLGYYLIQPK